MSNQGEPEKDSLNLAANAKERGRERRSADVGLMPGCLTGVVAHAIVGILMHWLRKAGADEEIMWTAFVLVAVGLIALATRRFTFGIWRGVALYMALAVLLYNGCLAD